MDEVFVLQYEVIEKEQAFGVRGKETETSGRQKMKEIFPVTNDKGKAQAIVDTLMQNQVFLANMEEILDDMDT